MTTHHLRCSPGTVHWGFLDASLPDVLLIDSGDTVRIDTVSGNASRLPLDRARFGLLAEHQEIIEKLTPRIGPHILTGPIGIRGAEPGDLLHVRIDKVELRQNWGWNEIAPGCGLLPKLESEIAVMTLPIDLQTGEIELPWAARVKASPFFGVMAVKPHLAEGAVTSLIPGTFGGNLDVRHLLPGAELCFPVHHHDAGFSVGDGHALQGDGEVVGTAVETALAGEFTFTLSKGTVSTQFPFVRLPGTLLTMAVDEDLDRASECAVQQAVELLETVYGLTASSAYRHCSLMGQLAISQVVNVKKGVHFLVDVSVLRQPALSQG